MIVVKCMVTLGSEKYRTCLKGDWEGKNGYWTIDEVLEDDLTLTRAATPLYTFHSYLGIIVPVTRSLSLRAVEAHRRAKAEGSILRNRKISVTTP